MSVQRSFLRLHCHDASSMVMIVMIYSVDDGDDDGNNLKPSSGSRRLRISAWYQ